MSALLGLIPIALGFGILALLVFLWSLKNGQYDDLDGAAARILIDDEQPADTNPDKKEQRHV
ncbi:cbb3-type cytochrome oxidase assembly protein CcoS [Tianweitania sp. BSSL-BM11]|uniref:Cbb3-type cytochrome oxidase assembly protein CcoS n=1 Tax=Tianweitania aestuarii TaxID=2814886 RepID=A0ABS5RX21_9HYPH|nr:cbb3-type cytochrome oxidase assembly protein CcoS [Tianweitania aestuarii]MBS9721571.1 cbb3-type cytochrome oxidase assembly protein CcoS [Tianweitania aestuarii]